MIRLDLEDVGCLYELSGKDKDSTLIKRTWLE
jgi:hypothetical protein